MAALTPVESHRAPKFSLCIPRLLPHLPPTQKERLSTCPAPISQISCTPPGPQPDKLHLLTKRCNESVVSSCENLSAFHPLLLQSLPPTDPAGSLCSQMQPTVALHVPRGPPFPRLWYTGFIHRCHLFTGRLHVFSHLTPLIKGAYKRQLEKR